MKFLITKQIECKKSDFTYLGVCHIHDILVSFYAFHNWETISVKNFCLRVTRDNQNDISCATVLQRFDLVTEKKKKEKKEKKRF